jgi:hypothetical protein
LDEQGVPGITQRALIIPPSNRLGPLTQQERAELIAHSPIAGRYEEHIDRESAYEKLSEPQPQAASTTQRKRGQPAEEQPDATGATQRKRQQPEEEQQDAAGAIKDVLFGSTGPRGGRREGLVETLAKSAARSMGSSIAREISRGVLGSLFGGGSDSGRRRRRSR